VFTARYELNGYVLMVNLSLQKVKCGMGERSRYSYWLHTERSGDRIPVGSRFSALVQTGPGAHTASYMMGTGSFPGGKAAGAWR
jgi:hypothetical protein